MMSYFTGVLLFALGIAFTIALHEWGHFTAARYYGMKVRRFFVGFGPEVFSFQRGETVYGLKAIPLGGFCDIVGMTNQDEVDPEDEPRAMRNKPWWQRIIVLLGGIIMNLLIALIILYGLAVTSGLPNQNPDTTAVVGEVGCVAPRQLDAKNLAPCTGSGPAAAGGVKSGDRIVGVDSTSLQSFEQLREYVKTRPNQTITLHVERRVDLGGRRIIKKSASRLDETGREHTVGAIGVTSKPLELFVSYGPVAAIGATAGFAGSLVTATLDGLASFPAKLPGVVASIFGAEREADGPISVVGASNVGGVLAEHSAWPMFFLLLASLNFFLAFFNLVPLPPLDGGHIAVVLYERVRDFVRKLRGLAPMGPVNYDKLIPLTVAVAALLAGVGIIVIVADIVSPVQLFG